MCHPWGQGPYFPNTKSGKHRTEERGLQLRSSAKATGKWEWRTVHKRQYPSAMGQGAEDPLQVGNAHIITAGGCSALQAHCADPDRKTRWWGAGGKRFSNVISGGLQCFPCTSLDSQLGTSPQALLSSQPD